MMFFVQRMFKFLSSSKNNDLIILTETWSNKELLIPGFHLFTVPAKTTPHEKKMADFMMESPLASKIT